MHADARIEPAAPEQRREMRYPLQTEAVLQRATGERICALSLNVSGGGMLLSISEPGDLAVGELVTCALRLYDRKPPQSWGEGRVVRVENSVVAIDFKCTAPPAPIRE